MTTKRILLVEDDDSFRRALTEVLRTEGFEISPASDSPAALEILQQEPIDAVVTLDRQPDVVISDIRMPGYNAVNVISGLRDAGCRCIQIEEPTLPEDPTTPIAPVVADPMIVRPFIDPEDPTPVE